MVAKDDRALTSPRPFSEIERPRVTARITDAATHRATFLVAPAGSGKSVAIAHYLHVQRVKHVRYHVRPENSELFGFIRGFAAALHDVVPSALAVTGDVLQSALASDEPEQMLVEWTIKQLAYFKGTCFLDDLHLVSDSRALRFVRELFARAPETVHFLVATRSTKGLPIAAWTASGVAECLDEEMLKFTRDEVAVATRIVRHDALDGEVDDMLSFTRGWPMALGLALQLSTNVVDRDRLALQTRQLVYQYLLDQVYSSLDSREREVLRFGVMLPELRIELFETAGFDDAHAILDALTQRTNFVSVDPRDARAASPTRYRCHDLFRDYLEHETKLQGERAVRALRLRAAEALEEHRELAAALRCYISLREHKRTTAILRHHGIALGESGYVDLVQEALASLPEAVANSDEAALALRGQMELYKLEWQRAVVFFERALEQTTEHERKAQWTLRMALGAVNLGQDPSALLEPFAFDLGLPDQLRGEILSRLVRFYTAFEKPDRARAAFDEAERLTYMMDSTISRATGLMYLGVAATILGDRQRANALLTRAARLGTECQPLRSALIASYTLAAFALVDDNIPAALRHAKDVADGAAIIVDRLVHAGRISLRLMLAVQLGDERELGAALDEALAAGSDEMNFHRRILDGQAYWAAWGGDFARALDLVHVAYDRYAMLTIVEERLIAIAVQALCASVIGNRAAVDRLLKELRDGVQAFDTPESQSRAVLAITRAFSTLALAFSGRRALALRTLGAVPRVGEGLVALHEAVSRIVRGYHDGVFKGEVASQLDAMHQHYYGGFAKLIEAALRSMVNKSEATLTNAEQAVLRALAAGSSPKEIAFEMGSSVNTVRTHIRRIIKKFGCSGSDQAVSIARNRGLL